MSLIKISEQVEKILDLVISSLEEKGDDRSSDFKPHKARLRKTDKDSIEALGDIVTACSYIEAFADRLKGSLRGDLEAALTQSRADVINFLDSAEGKRIYAHEHTAIPLLEVAATQGDSLASAEMELPKETSLLSCLLGIVPTKFSLPIIHKIISNCEDLSKRSDLIAKIIKNNSIGKSPDMSETFDLLVSKGMPCPSKEQLETLLTNERFSSGKNARKLAESFLYKGYDSYPASFILNRQRGDKRNLAESRTESRTESRIFDEQRLLSTNLFKKVKDPKHFAELTAIFIRANDDEFLEKFLKLNAGKFLEGVPDQASILGMAMEGKLTETCKILIGAGFDPLRREEGQVNPFALACEYQGETFLESYLDSIKKKFGEKKVIEVLSADGGALKHAISGRGYVKVVALLEDNGADFHVDHLDNLLTAAKKGHAGVFNRLLGESPDKEIEEIKEKLPDDVGYVIDQILLDHLTCKTSATAKSLGERIIQKESSLTEGDLFRICESSGSATLKSFAKYMHSKTRYEIKDHVNDKNDLGRTPLYYAIKKNAYNSLVSYLLECGADPDSISTETEINAATLAVKNKEPGTLEIILGSEKLSIESVKKAYSELATIVENNVITNAFIRGLRADQVTELGPSISSDLLLKALEAKRGELGKQCLNKFSKVAGGVLTHLIEEQNLEKLEKLLENFEIEDFRSLEKTLAGAGGELSSERRRSSLFDTEDNRPANVVSAPSGGKLADEIKAEYLGLALEISEEADPRSTKREQANQVIRILQTHGFDSVDVVFRKRLKAVGIESGDCFGPRSFCAPS
jgi:ankyrin repeat protein